MPIGMHTPTQKGVKKIQCLAVGMHAKCQIHNLSDHLFHLSLPSLLRGAGLDVMAELGQI